LRCRSLCFARLTPHHDSLRARAVNFFGVVRCCKAFLPLLKEQAIERSYGGSRILNLTSLAGVMPGAPGSAAYGASKHAAQAFSQSLRGELNAFGIQVSTVNPSVHGTPLLKGAAGRLEELWKGLSEEKREEYGEGASIRSKHMMCSWILEVLRFHLTQLSCPLFTDFFNRILGMVDGMTALAWNADVVADLTLGLLEARKMPPEFVVGIDGRYLFVLFRLLPWWVFAGIGAVAPTKPMTPAVLKQKKKKNKSE